MGRGGGPGTSHYLGPCRHGPVDHRPGPCPCRAKSSCFGPCQRAPCHLEIYSKESTGAHRGRSRARRYCWRLSKRGETSRGSSTVAAAAICQPSMAMDGHSEELDKQERRERERASGEIEDGLASTFGAWKRQRVRWRCSVHGGHVQSRCHPLKRFLEHVACSEVAGAGHWAFSGPFSGGDFGPFPGRIGHWAKNEVCQARPALQL